LPLIHFSLQEAWHIAGAIKKLFLDVFVQILKKIELRNSIAAVVLVLQ
jgi:hypothetical protein